MWIVVAAVWWQVHQDRPLPAEHSLLILGMSWLGEAWEAGSAKEEQLRHNQAPIMPICPEAFVINA